VAEVPLQAIEEIFKLLESAERAVCELVGASVSPEALEKMESLAFEMEKVA